MIAFGKRRITSALRRASLQDASGMSGRSATPCSPMHPTAASFDQCRLLHTTLIKIAADCDRAKCYLSTAIAEADLESDNQRRKSAFAKRRITLEYVVIQERL